MEPRPVLVVSQIVLAEETTAAGDDKGDHHTVANLQVGDVLAGGLDDAHEFVAEDIARFGLRDLAPIEVQVRAADGGGRHPEDDVVRLLKAGVRHGIDPDIVGSVIGQRSHGMHLLQWWMYEAMQRKLTGTAKFRPTGSAATSTVDSSE